MVEPSCVLQTREKCEKSARFPWAPTSSAKEAAGLAAREAAYALATALAADPDWHDHVDRLRPLGGDERGRGVDLLARQYGRNRENARALFATWLEECCAVTPGTRGQLEVAMANAGDLPALDAGGLEPGDPRQWPDARTRSKWDHGIALLVARGGPRCVHCRRRFLQAREIGHGNRPSFRVLCESCSNQVIQPRAATDLLDAVCPLVPGTH